MAASMLASPRSHAKPVDEQTQAGGHLCRLALPFARAFPILHRGPFMVRAAIVGLGRWGRSLVTSVQGKSDDIRFVAAHTRTRATAEDFCRDQAVPLVDSYQQILAAPGIDAVGLATPHTLHEQQVLAAAAAGKHIHVEKPITLDRGSAGAAGEGAANAGGLLGGVLH